MVKALNEMNKAPEAEIFWRWVSRKATETLDPLPGKAPFQRVSHCYVAGRKEDDNKCLSQR